MANPTVVFLAPPGGPYSVHLDGILFTAAADGSLAVDAKYLPVMLSAGWARRPISSVTTTAARPTANLVAGQMSFDSTLGKPVWRNAANTGWVDATGASV